MPRYRAEQVLDVKPHDRKNISIFLSEDRRDERLVIKLAGLLRESGYAVTTQLVLTLRRPQLCVGHVTIKGKRNIKTAADILIRNN